MSCIRDLRTSTLVATLPGTWHCWVSVRTGWPSVTILWWDEIENLICNVCLWWQHIKLSEQIHPFNTLCMFLRWQAAQNHVSQSTFTASFRNKTLVWDASVCTWSFHSWPQHTVKLRALPVFGDAWVVYLMSPKWGTTHCKTQGPSCLWRCLGCVLDGKSK